MTPCNRAGHLHGVLGHIDTDKQRLAHGVLRLPALQMRNEINQPFGMTQNEAATVRLGLSLELVRSQETQAAPWPANRIGMQFTNRSAR